MKLCYPVATPDSNVPLMAFWGENRFEENVKIIKEIGYDGAELLVRDGRQLDIEYIKTVLENNGLQAAAVGSSPIFTQDKLTLSHKDREKRKAAFQLAKAGIDVAAALKVPYCIGKFRGNIDENTDGMTMRQLTEILRELALYGEEKGAELLLEPQSAPGINNLHTVEDVLQIEKEIGAGQMGILLDMFHMDIGEASMYAAVVKAGKKARFIHASENERLAVGAGRLSIKDMIEMLKVTGYEGFISVEVAQKPDSLKAAKLSFETLSYWLRK